MLGGGVGRRVLRVIKIDSRKQGRHPRRRLILAAALAAIAGIAISSILIWQSKQPDLRAREYSDASACLLTGAAGVTDKETAPVWAGMQAASLQNSAKVQYLEINGPQTAENGKSYLASLIQSRCDLVVTAGQAPNDVLEMMAPTYGGIHFVGVGTRSQAPNVKAITSTDNVSLRTAVQDAVLNALGD